MKTQLLCTFTTQHNLEQTIRDITKHFKIVFDKIYVLQNEDKPKELICTYNVDQNDDIDFNLVHEEVKLKLEKKYADFILHKEQWQDINFFPFTFPCSPKSLSFDKIKDFEGIVKSIKGQYIIFKNGNVLNIRKHTGYDIIIEY